jgi:glycosyltransferase involved in cell wall biosynthesis
MTNTTDSEAARLPAALRETTFIVVPAYNEASCIAQVVGEIREAYPNVVVVDDGSTDNTFGEAKRNATYALRHVINRGQGAALQTGIEFALARGAQYVVTFDADGQHCVDDLPAMIAPIHRGACEITLGSRFLGKAQNLPASRRRMLRMGVLFTRVVNRVHLTDAHNGFRAFSRRAAEKIHITLDRMAHASELIDQIKASGLPFKEVPVHIRYTEYSLRKGQSARGAFRIVFQYLLGRVLQ